MLRALSARFWFWMVIHSIFAVTLIAIQFVGLGHDTVLLIHDQYFPLTGSQALANLDILSSLNGGTPNSFLLAVNGFDSILFAGLYSIGLSAQQAEIVYLSFLLSIALILMHYGFFRLLKSHSYVISIFPAYAFAFSPFLLIYYNIGVFWSFTNMLAMAILPFTVAVFRELLSLDQDDSRIRNDIAFLGVCLAVYGFVLYLAIPVGLTLLSFFVFEHSPRVGYKNLACRFIPALAIAVLLALAPIFAGYIERYSFGYSFAEGPLANSTSGLIQGGVLAPMLQHASWAIYTLWSPRVILAFPSHFTSLPYVLFAMAEIVMGVIVLLCIRGTNFIRACWIGLLVSVFFAKGSNQPFGAFFDWALQNISILGLIRSPDSKFGLTIAFLLVAILGLGFAEFVKNKKRVATVVALIFLMALPCLNARILLKGMVIRGENSTPFQKGSYAFPLDDSFMETAQFIKGLSQNSAIYFSSWEGTFNTPRGFTVILKDPLADFVMQPVYFNGYKSITAVYISNLVANFEVTGDISYLRQLGIRYIVVNLLNTNEKRDFSKLLANQSVSKVFSNKYYRILQINGVDNVSPVEVRTENSLIDSENLYRKYLDTLYEINTGKIDAGSFDLILKTANSKNWRAFAADNFWTLLRISFREFIFHRRAEENEPRGDFKIEKYNDSGFNHWSIKRQSINADGSVGPENSCQKKIFLVFLPQMFLFLLTLFSCTSLLVIGFVIYFQKPTNADKDKSNQ